MEIIRYSECYEGFNIEEGCVSFGTQEELEKEGFKEIEWSNEHWDTVSTEFHLNLEEEIQKYEKRYRTTVERIAIVGELGLWHGNPIGGKVIRADANPLNNLGGMDDIAVNINEDGQLEILGMHHDGTHHFNLYFLTEGITKRNGIDMHDPVGHDMELIHKKIKPHKLSKGFLSYYGFQKSK